jgi:hypothetical protein
MEATDDTAGRVAEIARRWHDGRAARRDALAADEGEETFHGGHDDDRQVESPLSAPARLDLVTRRRGRAGGHDPSFRRTASFPCRKGFVAANEKVAP